MIQRKRHQALHPHQAPLPHPQAHQEFSGMSGSDMSLHDPHTLRAESQWPDPFCFQILSGPSVKVTEKPMKSGSGLWMRLHFFPFLFVFFPLFLPLNLKTPGAVPAAKPPAPVAPGPESGRGCSWDLWNVISHSNCKGIHWMCWHYKAGNF